MKISNFLFEIGTIIMVMQYNYKEKTNNYIVNFNVFKKGIYVKKRCSVYVEC